MKKLLLTSLFLITSIICFAKEYTFVSYSWGAFKTNSYKEKYDEQYFTSRVEVHIYDNWIIIKAGTTEKVFSINKVETNADQYKGIYYYCSDGMLLNVYRNNEGEGRILLTQENQYFWFEL